MRSLPRRETRGRERGDAQDRDRADRRHDAHRAGRPTSYPDAEPEKERGQGGDEVALADAVEMIHRERGDLTQEKEDVRRRRREEGTDGRRLLAANRRGDDERRGREHRQPQAHDHERAGVPRELLGQARRGRRGLLRHCPVCAQEIARVVGVEGEQDDRGQAEEPEDRQQPPQRRGGAAEPGVQAGCEEERGQEQEGLEPDGRGQAQRQQEEALPFQRGLLEHASQRHQCDSDRRVEERLRHQQAAVPERRREHGERCRDERPARSDEALAPEVDGHRGERHCERLERLRGREAALDVLRECERDSDERGSQEAVVGQRGPAHGERPVLPERLSHQAVDHLVGRDPRHVEGARDGKPGDGREDDDRADDEGRVPGRERAPDFSETLPRTPVDGPVRQGG